MSKTQTITGAGSQTVTEEYRLPIQEKPVERPVNTHVLTGGQKSGTIKKAKKDKAALQTPVRKPHRFRPGTVALREIRKEQKRTDFAIRRAPFRRLVREIALDMFNEVRITPEAFDAIQTIAEEEMIKIMDCANKITIGGKRQTIKPKDLRTAVEIIYYELYKNKCLLDTVRTTETKLKYKPKQASPHPQENVTTPDSDEGDKPTLLQTDV